ncbi:MAG: CCA tRNA nucleotidyltransferase [Planctomycetales bacterium]|nr:CCA tRNA nucleotidyltransferase [Planctomycetales bacterium]
MTAWDGDLPGEPPRVEHSAARDFAIRVVRELRSAGFESLWAGGCVRDQLLGKTPKDYDVATNATPDEVRQVFGRRRTIPVGAAFGVITVLGRGDEGQIEVATFRRDAEYSDGRHPDSVSFSTAEEDALRRDFTINGLFYDPIAERVIDYVGGEADLGRGIVRAIRDPDERIAEDKLRMLRAVRFAATFDFELEAATLAAVQRHAEAIVVVSAERIAQELRRMLVDSRRVRAVRLLRETDLLPFVLPESERLFHYDDGVELPNAGRWERTLSLLAALRQPTFATSLAALVREMLALDDSATNSLLAICGRWRLSNHEAKTAAFLLDNEEAIRRAVELPWPRVQRLLIAPSATELMSLARAVVEAFDESPAGVEFCEEKLAQSPETLNPPPLVTGNELKAAGLKPGPRFRELLEAIRDAQLEGRLTTVEQALEWARNE